MPVSLEINFLLAIVVINFRTPQKTIECLASLLPQVQGAEYKVIVIDNSSGDDSCQAISNWLHLHDKGEIVELHESDFNGGFSYGNNLGIKLVNAQHYLLLNSDTLVSDGAIKTLLAATEKYPEAGLLSPRILSSSGDTQASCFRLLNPIGEFCKAAQTGIIDRFLNNYVATMEISDLVTKPQWTSFACVLVRAEVFKDVGLLDDSYFMYFEDVEFCARATRAGWLIVNLPEAQIEHLMGGSSSVVDDIRNKRRLPRYYYESRSRYFYQIFGQFGLAMANILWTIGFLLSSVRRVFGRRDKALVKKQYTDIWINFLNPLRPYTHPDSEKQK